jgi:DNA-binding MarR family transcriptional regulator
MDLTVLTTYQALVYQSRANRAVKELFEQILREYNLTMMQWSVLGFIKDAGKQGVRISDLAGQIDTSLAFITNSVNALEAKGWVYRVGHETDNRAKLVCVASEYRKKLDTIEQRLQKKLGDWFSEHIDRKDLEAHMRVLRDISEKEKTINK